MINADDNDEARRFFGNISARVLVAARRKNSLARCLTFRGFIKNGNPAGCPQETIVAFLRIEQRNLLNLRRYRETGSWSTGH